MKRLIIGILAHVDAGKTTLAESILYQTGSIRHLGRVDHKNAFLDTYELERSRGITIFSKQVVFTNNDMEVMLLDTPGHVDFSSEMERTLQVLDYAILVISGSDGVQGHTETLWKMLIKYCIPTFVFINKMDMYGTHDMALMEELKKQLSDKCVNFNVEQDRIVWMENVAMCDELLLEKYILSGVIETRDVKELIIERKVFPCYFGSALKLVGVEEFLNGLEQFTNQPSFPQEFGAKVYKITRDEQGNRLTYMKITGGVLKVKMQLTDKTALWEEKVDQIRIYSGDKYITVNEAPAGAVCAVTGLSKTYPGEGLGIEVVSDIPMLKPILSYRIILPMECDAYAMLSQLRLLEEEDPQLHIVWIEQLKEIRMQLMGEIQIEILKSLIMERFGVEVEFESGNIVYKETILEPVEGVGHFEPLRHYAEVHLLMEPGELDSGLTFSSSCSEDQLDRNWQRLILTHLEEKKHVGVLTGSYITDMKITLITGRAHIKHTEGGDFRQATYRAVRQGLKKSKSVLLEPYYNYRLEIPSETVGRAMSDIQRMYGAFDHHIINNEMCVLEGSVPVATMRGYQTEVIAYTKGRGSLICTLKGYEPCHNADEVMVTMGYDSERDKDNPTDSIFCAQGAGFVVPWNKVEEYMHVDSEWKTKKDKQLYKEQIIVQATDRVNSNYEGSWQEDKELEDIFTRTFGPIKNTTLPSQSGMGYEKKTAVVDNAWIKQTSDKNETEQVKEYLLVDGYNIIFAWNELKELANDNIEAARNKLMDILCNYQGFKKQMIVLVFDAYKVKGGVGSVQEYHGIHVVYTKEAETADMYIEKITHKIAPKHHVIVATSDAMEQLIIMGQGAVRLSANDFKEEIIRVNEHIRKEFLDKKAKGRNYIGNHMNENMFHSYKDEDGDRLI